MDEEEDPAVVVVVLDEAFDWVIVLGAMGVCPVRWCVHDGSEVSPFAVCYRGCVVSGRVQGCISVLGADK